ncbi:nucleotidyltransferase family protein [Phenylobacterium sp.]|uniref:nucleotidyltransferase family protein n=1 Tax=Phenylobacterium sp. TaxID=1871053 RepID=UPI0025FCD8C7|nr:nucleotidyltransferase family protein [Phenylobacterium sp.]MBX3486131.1 nucleotidyltransferase family protein [Phenylobacterium sp.]MCW5759512.1 nucleotidyltransferase family protein [Phenylobacterium sp.]
MSGFAALILAGSRAGVTDAVAAYGGATHKALIRLEGRTLLSRVAVALRDAGAARIAVVSSHPEVRAEAAVLGVEVRDEEAGPSASVKVAGEHLGTPLLVTTADHALLQGDWVRRFLDDVPTEADVAALVAARATVEAAAPGTERTWIRLADGHWSGCNLFYLANARAMGVVDLWRRVEAERKRPWRQAQILGLGMLARYALGRLTLKDAAARLGTLAGVKAAIVETPYGLASVDVDKPADLDLVRRIVASLP